MIVSQLKLVLKVLKAGEQVALQCLSLCCESVVFCVFISVLLYTELSSYSPK